MSEEFAPEGDARDGDVTGPVDDAPDTDVSLAAAVAELTGYLQRVQA